MRRSLIPCWIFLASATPLFGETAPGRVADKIQEAWNAVQTYKASFSQVVFSKGMGTRDESKGTVYVVKPGKLRWESATDNITQLLSGNEFFVIKPNARRGTVVVDVWRDLKKAMDVKPLEFLVGASEAQGDLPARGGLRVGRLHRGEAHPEARE